LKGNFKAEKREGKVKEGRRGEERSERDGGDEVNLEGMRENIPGNKCQIL